MLSSEVDEKLEPLRLTLKMSGDDFREGVFSWRGFLYYKWSMENFWPEIIAVLRDIRTMQPLGAMDMRARSVPARQPQRSIIEKVRDGGQRGAASILDVYDAAYDDLVATPAAHDLSRLPAQRAAPVHRSRRQDGRDLAHRQLLALPLPRAGRQPIDAEELTAIFQDFNSSFSRPMALPKRLPPLRGVRLRSAPAALPAASCGRRARSLPPSPCATAPSAACAAPDSVRPGNRRARTRSVRKLRKPLRNSHHATITRTMLPVATPRSAR